MILNSFLNDKFSDWSKLKAIADDKMNVIKKKSISILGSLQNIMGKGEIAVYQHFHLFPQCFQKPSFSRSCKVGIVWERNKRYFCSSSSKRGHNLEMKMK